MKNEIKQPCWVRRPQTEEERDTLIKTLNHLGIDSEGYNFFLVSTTWIYLINKNQVIKGICNTNDFNNCTIEAIKSTYPELKIPKEEYKFTPFEQVLVRDTDYYAWRVELFSHIGNNSSDHKYKCMAHGYNQCIPFKGNEHLVNTTNNPN